MGVEENAASSSKPSLNEAILLVSSLIPLSHSIKVFAGKWQTLRIKLDELLTNLTAIKNCELSENPSLSEAVQSILATLTSCDDLATRCSEFSFSGKLLMQSDLDILTAKLDSHIESFSDIYAAGLLEQSYALVVSRPSFSASKDDVRFYINDIISRLKIGSSQMKKKALVAFNEVIQEEERYIKIALEIDGFVNILVNFLDYFLEREVQEEAVKSICLILGFESFKTALTNAGLIAPLIRIIESGGSESTQLSKELAARCLMKVTENSDNVWAVSAHGGVTALLKICFDCNENGIELVCLCCGVLKNLVSVEEIKRFMVEEGAIGGLVELARSKDELAQISSLDLLQTMAYRDESVRETIIKEGGIQALVEILDPNSSVSTKTREVAFKGITNICFTSELSITAMISYGFMDHILYFLRNGEIPELALKAAFWLCGTSIEAKKLMGEEGFIPVLVKFLDSKSLEMREMAAETLSSMMVIAKNRKKFIQSDQNVAVLMQMLDPDEVNSTNKKLLLSILMSLTSSSGARKKIMSSGYVRNIEKLAEAEVSDAKKIVRKLSSSRFRSVLNVFWGS